MAAIMEKRARATFRDVLALHYIDGISKTGEEVDMWLKTHGGWFPDPQEVYGDGTPLTQPKDEGWDVMSKETEKAMKEAKGVMGSLKEFFGDGVAEHIGRPDLKASVKKWLADLPRDRSRSPRRCVITQMMIATMEETIRLQDQTIEKLQGRDRSRSPRRCVIPQMTLEVLKVTIQLKDQIIEALNGKIKDTNRELVENAYRISYLEETVKGKDQLIAMHNSFMSGLDFGKKS